MDDRDKMPQTPVAPAPDVGDTGSGSPRPHLGRKPWRRIVALGLVLVAAFVAVYYSPLQPWLRNPQQVRHTVSGMGFWAYPACVLASAILVACGVPRLLLCFAGAALLGFWPGLVLSQTGTLLGYYGVFLFVRWGGRDLVLHHWPKLQRWADAIQQQGVVGVILIRQVPIHGSLVNLCLGLTRLHHRHFLAGTAIGLVPEAVPASLVGAGLTTGSAKDLARYAVMAAIAFALVWIGCRFFMNRLRKTREGSAMMAEVTSLEGVSD